MADAAAAAAAAVAKGVCDGLFIGGRFVAPRAGGTFDVVDPATEEVVAKCPAAGPEDVDLAVTAATEAFKTWGVSSGAERAAHLRALAEAVKSNKAHLSALETVDSGKPYPEAEWDIDDVSGCLEYYAGLAEALDKKQGKAVEVGDDDFRGQLRYEAAGVVAAVTPWNYPMLMAIWKVAPALAAGCTVVLKPSELAPMTCLELGKLARSSGMPAGVLNIVTGLGPVAGEALVSHPGVDKVSFTGSVATGSRIMRRCAEGVRGCSLELGGKSPAIVFDDVDIPTAVEWVMFGCFWTNGQICSATSRLLIHSRIADKFLALLREETARIKAGHPFGDDTKLGPVVSKSQYAKVMRYIEAGKAEGASVLVGGGRPVGVGPVGYYVAPTVFTNVTSRMSIWREEIFGPVLSVMTFDTEAEAIERANDSEFGLAAAVFTDDLERMDRVTRLLRVGIVWNNCSQPCFSQLPWGGTKHSGVGRDLGEFGLNSFLEPKQITTYVSDQPFGWYMQSKL